MTDEILEHLDHASQTAAGLCTDKAFAAALLKWASDKDAEVRELRAGVKRMESKLAEYHKQNIELRQRFSTEDSFDEARRIHGG